MSRSRRMMTYENDVELLKTNDSCFILRSARVSNKRARASDATNGAKKPKAI